MLIILAVRGTGDFTVSMGEKFTIAPGTVSTLAYVLQCRLKPPNGPGWIGKGTSVHVAMLAEISFRHKTAKRCGSRCRPAYIWLKRQPNHASIVRLSS